MAAKESPRTTMATRSRKIQPGLKEKAEQFLAKPNFSKSPSSNKAEGFASRKRKLEEVGVSEKPETLEVKKRTESNQKRPATQSPDPPQKSQRLKSPEEADEKRMKRYRKQAPFSYLQKLQRAQTQR
jgi:hypothetical protein